MFIIRLQQLRIVILLSMFHLLSLFAKRKHWIICERGTDARDNGYCFYRYMKEKHPERKVYYLITKDSADYEKVREDAVLHNSIKSYWLIASAQKIVSTHYATVLPLPIGGKIFGLFGLHEKFYFLQHGITKDNIRALYADAAPMKLFVCGAKPEYEDIKRNYGHPEGVVRYTGLARFDYLHDAEPKKQILIMPTWRMHIQDENDFINSEYFIKWQNVLVDKNLNKVLRENNIKLIFYVHYEMQKHVKHFHVDTDNVIIAKFDDHDVQKLLKDSALFVTDYSSVFFDFAYMKKPSVYYQFDAYHYEKGYFDYREMGFGEVCACHEQLIDAIKATIANGFELDKLYEERIMAFFPLYDQNNCERIYNAIIELI